MNFFEYLEEFPAYARSRDWRGLEERFAAVCRELAGDILVQQIAQVATDDYERALVAGFSSAISLAVRRRAAAVYFEYDMDNDWQSSFFICPRYRRVEAEDDDWACSFSDSIKGPDFQDFARIYHAHGFAFDKPEPTGRVGYLVARTVAAVGRASDNAGIEDVALCVAFHDQTPILRLREQAEPSATDNPDDAQRLREDH